MSEARVTFTLDGNDVTIQCSQEEKMRNICQKYESKIGINMNFLVFLYGGNQLKFDLSFQEQATSPDRTRNEMNVLVYKTEIDGLVCPHCGQKIRFNTDKIDDIISSNNNIKDNITGTKLIIDNIIRNCAINLVNIQIKNIDAILNTINEDIKKNNNKLKNLLSDKNFILHDKININNNLNINNNKNVDTNNKNIIKREIEIILENINKINIDEDDKEILKIKKEITFLSDLFLFYTKIYGDSKDNKELENLTKSFLDYYSYIFKIGSGFEKLNLKELYLEVILMSDKFFSLGKNLGLFDGPKNKIYKEEFSLISEFNLSVKLLKQYIKILEKSYKNIHIVFNQLYNHLLNKDLNVDYINNLMDIIKDIQPKINLNDIFVDVLEFEQKKYENKEILKFILDSKHSNLYEDFTPIMDLIFSKEIINKLSFEKEIIYINFNSAEFSLVNKLYEIDEKNFGEMLLFYFENKIMKELNKRMTEEEGFLNNNLINIFKQYFVFLQTKYEEKNMKSISALFSMAFVKCFLYKLIKLINDNAEFVMGVDYIIQNIIKFEVRSLNPFRSSINLYILKLIFLNCGNLYEYFRHNFNKYHIEFFDEKEIIGMQSYNPYGFDFLFLPEQKYIENKSYDSIISKLFSLDPDKIINDNEINSALNNNIDLIFCILVNFYFSYFCRKRSVFEYKFNKIKNWFMDILKKEPIEALKNKKILKNIFMHLINKDKSDSCNNYNLFTYDQILCLSISTRFVLYTISSENKNSLFYKLLTNGNDTINKNLIFFKEYHLKDFSIDILETRNITCLTYKVINYIILSHIYFGYILKFVSEENIIKTLGLNSLKNKEDKYVEDYLFKNMCNELNFIQKILLPLIGVNNIIVFMDKIYKELLPKIISLKYCGVKETIKNQEKSMNDTINNIIINFDKYINEYYTYENISDKRKRYDDENILIDILLEKPRFYNDKELLEKKYPLLPYLALKNHIEIIDHFKNQFIYYYYNSTNYPFINSYLSGENNHIIKMINFLPKLNEFSNRVYDKLNMTLSRKDINKKTIKQLFNNELDIDIIALNNFIENNNKIFNLNKKIGSEDNIKEIININGTNINIIYKEIINLYNKFLEKMKISDDIKESMENIIIQESKENDYNFNYVIKNGNKITIQDKIDELILLYSKRERKINNYLNVYNGGKIIFNFDQIENKLEDEFIFGKRFFSEKQKMLIFSEELYEQEGMILKEIGNKIKQQKPNEEDNKKIKAFLNKKNEDNILNIFYELFFVLKYMTQSEFDLIIKEGENGLNDLIKYFEIKSYKLPQLKIANNSLNNILQINNLLYFYEIVFNQAFQYLTSNIKQKIIEDDFNIDEQTKNLIDSCLNLNKVIQLDTLISAVKKYIWRYIKSEDEYLFDFKELINKKDIWDLNDYNTNKFKEEFIKLEWIVPKENNEKNIIIKYLYNIIYEVKSNSSVGSRVHLSGYNDIDNDDIDNEEQDLFD